MTAFPQQRVPGQIQVCEWRLNMKRSKEPNLTNFAATLLNAMGINAPMHMSGAVLPLAEEIRAKAGGDVEKAFIFHVDAVPAYIVEAYPELFEAVRRHTQICGDFNAVMPSITPVCFGAMYSGAYPDENGVPCYLPPTLTPELIQPRISCTTVIEALVQAGKKVAVFTCSNGCIASMLYGRGADMFIIDGDDDEAMYRAADEALKQDRYDVIFLYQLSFDYTQHEYGPKSAEALNVLKTLTGRFESIAQHACAVWKDYRRLIVFNSDHGCHEVHDDSNHKGMHGDEIPEDMQMKWFFGAFSEENR